MRRAILSAGVLFLIAAAHASGQSAPHQFNSCSVGSNCERSNFDAAIANTSAIAFDFFLLSLDGSRRYAAKRSLVPGVATSRTNRAAETAPAPFDWRNGTSADDRSIRLYPRESRSDNSGEDLERTNTLQRSWWDWLERMRASQRSEFADDTREKRADSRTEPRNGDGNGERGKGDAKPDAGDHHESPQKPDHNDDVLEGILNPEPSTLLLIGSALPLALVFVRRRRR